MMAVSKKEFTLPLIFERTTSATYQKRAATPLDTGSITIEPKFTFCQKASTRSTLLDAADDRFSDLGYDGLMSMDADDSLERSRKNAEKAAEFEVEHNWMLKEEEERQFKKFDITKRRLAILIPDDDPLETIQHRLAEINSMVKPKAELSSFLEDMEPDQRERILKVTNTDVDFIKTDRRKGWEPIDRLRFAVAIVTMVAKASIPRRRYFNAEDPDASNAVLRRIRKKHIENNGSQNKSIFKSSLSFEMQLSMTMRPEYRSTQHIKRVMWVLRATRAFKHLFPSEMERELAKVVAYERYDDNRHLAYQGRPPDRFYYILSGRVQRLREYRLTSGCINKSMGFLNKGMTSDPSELDQQWPREYHLVAKGPVEVIFINKDDFIRLQHTTQGPPIDFLWSLDLFKEFPCDMFLTNPDAIDYKYYGQHRVVAKNGNTTPWLHVVKSGFVKLVRVQHIVDVRNDTKFATQSTEELGCGRAFSHASAMLGILEKQRKMKTLREISVPDLTKQRHCKERISPDIQLESRLHRRKSRTPKMPNSGVETTNMASQMSSQETLVSIPENGFEEGEEHYSKKSFELPPIVVTQATPRPSKDHDLPGQPGANLHPSRTFLTREKTEQDPSYSRRKKEPHLRKAYLQLDVLGPGEVFGLDEIAEKFRYQQMEEEGLENMEPPILSATDGPAISLVSDGAEVIRISKRFFLQYAQNNTMLRVETMQREYITTDEAKTILYNKETWAQYKNVLMQRLINGLSSR